ncbi:hypothetical protein A1Q2_08075 [Trichosporon asahii var. asahii CBS 8904]|uniref:Uncharacterized protein n=1 Tax=Trichosporon asahii var. asahii (strain CBS 8904) TaxID=1220162 RepID=K1VEZ6_TRIAC|nr:hypothetical protein A1Q2_08075 [Trichosporon asahii var. asahii CBS 8904]
MWWGGGQGRLARSRWGGVGGVSAESERNEYDKRRDRSPDSWLEIKRELGGFGVSRKLKHNASAARVHRRDETVRLERKRGNGGSDSDEDGRTERRRTRALIRAGGVGGSGLAARTRAGARHGESAVLRRCDTSASSRISTRSAGSDCSASPRRAHPARRRRARGEDKRPLIARRDVQARPRAGRDGRESAGGDDPGPGAGGEFLQISMISLQR